MVPPVEAVVMIPFVVADVDKAAGAAIGVTLVKPCDPVAETAAYFVPFHA
jgi:hypothetical protein